MGDRGKAQSIPHMHPFLYVKGVGALTHTVDGHLLPASASIHLILGIVARTVLRGLLGRKVDSRPISLFRRWQDRVAYDENKYLAAVAKRGSTLSSVLKLQRRPC
jgi:hypothetical protein